MKYFTIIITLLFLIHPCCYAADSQEIIFCETFNDQWKPVKRGTVFHAPTISWYATAKKIYGIPQITLSIYRHEGSKEILVQRRSIDVNPEWDTMGIRYMSLPSDGEFTIAITTPGGETLNKGRVKITNAGKTGTPPKEETLGARLEALFKKYAPQKEQ